MCPHLLWFWEAQTPLQPCTCQECGMAQRQGPEGRELVPLASPQARQVRAVGTAGSAKLPTTSLSHMGSVGGPGKGHPEHHNLPQNISSLLQGTHTSDTLMQAIAYVEKFCSHLTL